jgi:MinD superfamily P-loop ATPase
VIAAMKDTDFVLLVTEPTPFGLHDLKLAVEAVKILEIPMGLVINRADMGDDMVRDYAQAEAFPSSWRFPLTGRSPKAILAGEMFALAYPEWKARFRELVGHIETLAERGSAQNERTRYPER